MTAATRTARTFDHAARYWEDPDTGHVECRVCGAPIVREALAVRHAGETAPHVTPASRRDLPGVARALDVAGIALRELPGGASDGDRVQAIVTALYEEGMLRQRPAPRRGELALFTAALTR